MRKLAAMTLAAILPPTAVLVASLVLAGVEPPRVALAQAPSPAPTPMPPAPPPLPVVQVNGPASPVPQGSVVLLDARSSVCVGPLVWVPQRSTVLADAMTVFDQGDRKACAATVEGLPPGSYQVAVIGYGSPASPAERPPVHVQIVEWTVGAPAPPQPPAPGPPVPAPVPPGPTPPGPLPGPTAQVDEGIVRSSRDFWRFYLDSYGNWDVAGKGRDYNAQNARLQEERRILGGVVGKEIDRVVFPQVGPDGKFANPESSRAAMGVVKESLRSGMIRAINGN